MAKIVYDVTCIVIDDDIDLRDIFVELLGINNVTVLGTGINGHEAFELYKKFNPTIVFLDEFMPDFDGRYGMEKIRKYSPHANIILVTSATKNELKFHKDDITAMIEKPIQMDQLMAIVNKMMSLHS
ncbi:MAG: response regulator [Thaumarchaeota archaeon]|nr:response regulator [Nitrososphaerota archaeon]